MRATDEVIVNFTLKLKPNTNTARVRKLRHKEFPSRKVAAKELLKLLAADYPDMFNKAEPIPLKRDIDLDVQKRYPSYSKKAIGAAMHYWCRRDAYREALVAGNPRFDLDGKQNGEVEKR